MLLTCTVIFCRAIFFTSCTSGKHFPGHLIQKRRHMESLIFVSFVLIISTFFFSREGYEFCNCIAAHQSRKFVVFSINNVQFLMKMQKQSIFFPFHYLISNSKRFFNLCWHCEQYKFENGKIRIFRCASCTIFFISSNYNLLNEHFWLKKSVLCKHPAQDRAAAQVSKKVILPTNVYWGVKQTK